MEWTFSLTWTAATHASTPISEPSTNMMPGELPLRRSTNTAWKAAACFSFVTFFREVMWCVRISAFHKPGVDMYRSGVRL